MTTQAALVNLAPPKRRFTAEEYHRPGEIGILKPDERVELIEGEVITMVPMGSVHASTVRSLNELLMARVHGRAIVSVQDPIALAESSEPQPDLSLFRLREDWYRDAHPGPKDILLVIEVADTTLGYDLSTKARPYAENGLQEVWIVVLGTRI